MKKIVIGNWKMNPSTSEKAQRLFNSIKNGVGETRNVEIVICPPFTQFSIFNFQFSKNIKLGAQNCFWEQSGPFTGEVSPLMLRNFGCEYVILGHSERRQNFGETDEMINKKLKAALEVGLKPILCVGDKSRKSEQDIRQIQVQLEKALTEISRFDLGQVILVYEPIWAISTTKNGIAANPENAVKGKLFIQKVFNDIFSDTACPKILYGGSVNFKNAEDYIDAGFDGLLVGNASLNPKEFIKIIKIIDKIRAV